MNPTSRKTATLLNLLFQYLMMALMIVRGIVLPPLALQFIAPDLLGAWLASGNIVQWLMVSEGGAWLFLRQQTALEFGRGDRTALAEVIGSGGLLLCLLGGVIVLVGLGVALLVPGWLHVEAKFSREFITAFILTVIGMGLSLPACIPRAVGHGLQRQIAVNISLLVAEMISLGVSIVLLFAGFGVVALGSGPLVREAIQNVVNWPILAMMLRSLHIRPSFSAAYMKSMTGQIGWTFVNNLSGVMRRNVDALIVSQVFGNPAVLAVEWTKRFWEICSSLVARANTSFTPSLAHLYGEGDLLKFRTISKQLFMVTTVGLGIALGFGLALNEPFVRLWVGGGFYAGADYNLLVGLATVVSAIGFAMIEIMFAAGNVRRPAVAQLIQTVARIGVLFALVPSMGLLSIPLSMLASEVLGGVLYLGLEWKRMLEVPSCEILEHLRAIVRALVIAVVMAKAWEWLPSARTWPMLLAHGAFLGASISLAYYLMEPFVKTKVNSFVGAMVAVRKQTGSFRKGGL